MTLLLILMMVCNLWILFYLTWEHKEARKADNRKDAWNAHQRPPDDMMGKSRFSMPETKPQATAPMPNAATEKQSEAVDEKDVTFADEMETAGSHTAETKPSRQVPDEDLDEVFRDNRVHDTDGEFDGEPPEASGSTFDEIDRAARAVKDPKIRCPAGGQGIPRAGRDGVLQHVPAKQCPLRGKGVGNGGNLSCKHPARREENKNESGCTEGIRELQHP